MRLASGCTTDLLDFESRCWAARLAMNESYELKDGGVFFR